MAGALDTAFKAIAKQVVADLGSALDTAITYISNSKGSYNISTGKQLISKTSYSDIKVPVEFVQAIGDANREVREAKLYITPDLIGNNQPTMQDEVTLTYAGSSRISQIIDIRTYQGSQTYLFVIRVVF
jgi:hypothetical protein|tara:strand:+ start:311 stop:697 length:387 start_codon:yes stop_codon:yes gene_type:complete